MGGWSHEENNQKRTCERISKSDTSDKEDRGEKTEIARTCQEKGGHMLRRMLDAPVPGKDDPDRRLE